ncbi:MAG: carboxypeptidase-like regulatory domain-containing protein [Cyclobacteriaceae bacterium]
MTIAKYVSLVFILGFFSLIASAQGIIEGAVTDSDGQVLQGVNVRLRDTSIGTTTNSQGRFQLQIQSTDSVFIDFTYVGYIPVERKIAVNRQSEQRLEIQMKPSTRVLDLLEINATSESIRRQAGSYQLDPSTIKALPSPFLDFNTILMSLPGVVGYGELSSAYSVRGGNYDENLVYDNDMPVYRPFLIRAGEQEGLSFINPDMVENVVFSSGGWQARYGDRLSSNLAVTYKSPQKNSGSLSLGLLGGSAHIEGLSKNEKLTYIAGIRHKTSKYLLNTLETEGQYFPRFTDLQTYIEYKPQKDPQATKATKLGLLLSYSNNNYLVQPQSRESTFGTFSEQKRLFVAFQGQEVMNYDTYQASFRAERKFSQRFSSAMIFYTYLAREREYFDVESGYRLCDVDTNPGEDGFTRCLQQRGIGSEYRYGRNTLDALVSGVENRSVLTIDNKNELEFGFSLTWQSIDDHLHEYSFVDSTGFVRFNESINTVNNINAVKFDTYIQNNWKLTASQSLTYGLRYTYLTINNQHLISPRFQYAYLPNWERDFVFRLSAGLYQQPPFYREFRNFSGEINTDVKAQSSAHFIAGTDYQFYVWDRPFKLTAEAYYKYLWNVIPYDIDNVRLRYYADNIAVAYAAGFDFRLSGDFIPGDESWFSLGILSTRENVEGDTRGYIPRPSDQRINAAIFFRDHIPSHPDFRVSLGFFYASPFPFSPPGNFERRNSFRGKHYMRTDLGFQKIFRLNPTTDQRLALQRLTLGMEILNLTGSENPISYLWINDINNFSYAVPNALSARFLNLRLTANF